MPDPTTPPLPPGFTLDAPAQAGPVYGAPAAPTAPYQGPQAAANLAHTQQEVQQADATARATTLKANADAQTAQLAARTAQENYDQAHVAESPELVGVTGPALLAKLPADEAPMIKAMIEGRMAPPTASALKDPQWQQRLKWANQVDPDFNEARWQMRVKTMGDAATGRLAQANNALNTAIGHAGLLMDQAQGGGVAGHGDWPLVPDAIPTAVNAVQNAANKGSPGLTVYNDTAQKLGTEEARVYQGGAPNEGDTNRYVASLSANLPMDAKKAVIHNALELFASKITANLSQYDFGTTGGKPPLNVLDAQALHTLQTYAPDVLHKYFYAGFVGGPNGSPSGGPDAPPPTMPNDPVAPASGGTKDVVDASMTPVRREYMARLNAGQSAGDLVSFLRQSGVNDPATLRSATQQAQFRRQHPDVPVSQYDTAAIDHHQEQMGAVNKATNAAGQTGLGAAAVGAAQGVTGSYLPDIVGAAGGNAEQARLAAQYSAQDHPGSALLGNVVGGTTAALAGEGAIGAAGMESGVVRSLLADTGYGSYAGSGANPDNRLGGALVGGVTGLLGSIGGQALAKGGSAVLRGVTDKSVNALADAGVPLTVGQTVGQSGRAGAVVKGVEDRLAGFSGVGDMIKSRQGEGYRAWNSKAFDKALVPIGVSVDGATGEEAMQKASQAVSGAFSSALKGKSAVPDQPFIQAARGPLERLAAIKRDGLGGEIVGQIEESTKDLFDPKTGALSGENMQTFLEALRQIRESYRSDPLYGRVIGPSIKGLESATEGMFTRQAPEVIPAFNAAKAAYRRTSILSDAVNRAKNDNQSVFTPGQLGLADRTNAKKYDGAISAASGDSPFHDFHKDAVTVLPSKVPDSGTAGRLALAAGAGSLPALGAGAGFLSGDTKDGAIGGIGLTGVLALAYTKAGQKRIAQMLLSRSPAARALAEKITARVPIAGAAGTALTQTNGGQ